MIKLRILKQKNDLKGNKARNIELIRDVIKSRRSYPATNKVPFFIIIYKELKRNRPSKPKFLSRLDPELANKLNND